MKKNKITIAICATVILFCGAYLFKTEFLEPQSFHKTINKIKIGFTYDEVEEILKNEDIKYKKLGQDIILALLPRKFSYNVIKVDFDKNKKVINIHINK